MSNPSQSQRVKDPGAIHASVHLAKESPPGKPPPDIPDNRNAGTISDSARYLLHKNLFPDALPVTACFNIAALEQPTRFIYRDLIHLTAENCPGDFVRGCQRLPKDKATAVKFYETAGFSPACVVILTDHLSADPEDDVMDEEEEPTPEDEQETS